MVLDRLKDEAYYKASSPLNQWVDVERSRNVVVVKRVPYACLFSNQITDHNTTSHEGLTSVDFGISRRNSTSS